MKIWTPWGHLEQENAELRERIRLAEKYIDNRPRRSEVQQIVEAEIEKRTAPDMYFMPDYVKLATLNQYYEMSREIRELRDLIAELRRPWWKRLTGGR